MEARTRKGQRKARARCRFRSVDCSRAHGIAKVRNQKKIRCQFIAATTTISGDRRGLVTFVVVKNFLGGCFKRRDRNGGDSRSRNAGKNCESRREAGSCEETAGDGRREAGGSGGDQKCGGESSRVLALPLGDRRPSRGRRRA